MLALRAGALFDGHNRRGPSDVLIDAGRISAVQPAAERADAVEVVDLGSDVTLVPGLVDPHVHLVFDASLDIVSSVQAASDDELDRRMRAASRMALAGGVTTVRDLGDRNYGTLALRAELAAQPAAGPQVLVAGPPITTVQGHCWFLGGEATGIDALRSAVAERADRGTDVVKIMATGGQLTPGSHPHESQYTRTELSIVVSLTVGTSPLRT